MLRGIVFNGKLRGDLNSSVPVIITAFSSAQFSSTIFCNNVVLCNAQKGIALHNLFYLFTATKDTVVYFSSAYVWDKLL